MKLKQLVEQYITYRQTLGNSFKCNATHLRVFIRVVGTKTAVNNVRAEQVNSFLKGNGPITGSWHVRFNALRGFYRYAQSRGLVTVVPLPTYVPKRTQFDPYIYSRDELGRLLKAAKVCGNSRWRIEPLTLRTTLLLLYGAGLRVSEVRQLDFTDVDLKSALIRIRDSKFRKSRLVPLGHALVQALTVYAAWREAAHPLFDPQGPFFIGRSGERLKRSTLHTAFRRACALAEIRRDGGPRRQPRIHDLRHTFAVHRLTTWYQQGVDVQRLLPQLSVYMGHVCLSSTQYYLSMTPELLQEAGARFEHYAKPEDIHD